MDTQQNMLKGRLSSIDALRGFSMFWITGGGKLINSLDKTFDNSLTGVLAGQLHHAEWEGFSFYDVILPLFLIIAGLVLPLSVTKRLEKGESKMSIFIHVAKRSGLLILLGLIYNKLLDFSGWDAMRWSGVLQRIGICYFFAGLLVLNTKWRTQAIIAVLIPILFWAALMLIPVPGYGAGVLTMEGSLNSYIDQSLLPGLFLRNRNLLDNENILSTLPAIAITLAGVLAGHWLRTNNSPNRKAAGLAAAGLISLLIGYLWALVFPVIKILGTSSYVMLATGYSLLLVALFYWIIDVKGYKKWAFFFVVIGVNPITIYFMQRFVSFEKIAKFFAGGIASHTGMFELVVLMTAAVVARWLFLWFLYRKKIFLKL
jgi:predicted acyltransferase